MPRVNPNLPSTVLLGEWPAIAAVLTSTGQPWPEDAVMVDLRWWDACAAAGGEPRPGRGTLQKRWNFTERGVRNVTADPSRWQRAQP